MTWRPPSTSRQPVGNARRLETAIAANLKALGYGG